MSMFGWMSQHIAEIFVWALIVSLPATAISSFWASKSAMETAHKVALLEIDVGKVANNTTKLFESVNESLQENNKIVRTFEATGYKADITDDGKVKVVFLRKISKSDKEGEDMAEWREVVLPAWMWAQVTAEASLKLGFQALEKKGTK